MWMDCGASGHSCSLVHAGQKMEHFNLVMTDYRTACMIFIYDTEKMSSCKIGIMMLPCSGIDHQDSIGSVGSDWNTACAGFMSSALGNDGQDSSVRGNVAVHGDGTRELPRRTLPGKAHRDLGAQTGYQSQGHPWVKGKVRSKPDFTFKVPRLKTVCFAVCRVEYMAFGRRNVAGLFSPVYTRKVSERPYAGCQVEERSSRRGRLLFVAAADSFSRSQGALLSTTSGLMTS
uniref:Uncharacterized protein n=1 Tax=Branchiostoma floridae TaxID=7739 RepID=C3ZD11_BRAFL|eukprot:XP_002593511.1 hypothetical protein BRAFLDRAFT_101840 [Branchiostoma floridae]